MFEKMVAFLLELLLAIPFTLALGAYCVFAEGYALSKIWQWHIEPGVGHHATWLQCGIAALMLGIATSRLSRAEPKEADPDSPPWKRFVYYMISPWIGLAVAWCFT